MPALPGASSGAAPSLASGRVLSSIDRVVEHRYGTATELVAELRRDGRDADAVIDELVRRATRELAVVAALSGGAAALPGTGTAAAVMATGADVAYTISRLAELVLGIGIALGHDAASIEERRAWVLAVLSMGRGAATGVEGLAGRIGAEGGARLAASMSRAQLEGVNSRLATKLLARFASEQAATRLGRLLPFGIGAGVGAAGNVVIVRSVARTARRFFDVGNVAPPALDPSGAGTHPSHATSERHLHLVRPDDDVIDVEVVDDVEDVQDLDG